VPPDDPDDPDEDTLLTWLAGGAVLLLAGAGGVLALRRRDRPS
jgi:LPXTG-motif cell wall-anchored protein